MRSYRKLIQVNFNHTFYASGKVAAGDFKFFTTPATKKVLENYRLILKQNNNTLELIQECLKEDNTIEPLVEIDSTLEFEFVIKQQNKNFFNYTETKFPDMRREVFYFSNIKAEKIIKHGFLSQKEIVSGDDLVLIQTLSKEQELKGGGAIGFMLLKADKTINQTIESGNPFQYTINFAPRQAYWQYHVVKKYNSIKKVNIVDESKQIKFTERKDLATEEERVFLSDKKMPIHQINKQTFKLMAANGSQNISKTMYEKLPYPKTTNIEKHFDNENELIAKTYVYI